ncbi:MAG: T9SS type A sorting domain-containing protein, partial [Bacteroidia bacterium]
ENAHGLNPSMADHNGTTLSASITGVSGYTNLECYINCLADALVGGGSPACGIMLAAEEAMPTESLVQAFPNPSEGVIEVSLRGQGKTTLQVCDMNGKVVHEQTCAGRGTVRLDLRNLPKGVYILRAGTSSRKLVLK